MRSPETTSPSVETQKSNADHDSPTHVGGRAVRENGTDESAELSKIRTSLRDSEICDRLGTMSRRGKLAGYKPGGRGIFECDAFGQPFDSSLICTREDDTTIAFSLKMKPTMPTTFWVLMILSIWPGVWLTDSMLRIWFGWYDFNTYLWYLPLTILPLPWLYKKTVPASRNLAREDATKHIERICTALDGTRIA